MITHHSYEQAPYLNTAKRNFLDCNLDKTTKNFLMM